MDLDDLEHNTRDGVHIASLAGAWIATVAGFGGMRDHDGELSFAPRLPDAIRHICYRLTFRGRRLRIDVEHEQAKYTLVDGQPIDITHHGSAATITTDEPVELKIPPAPKRDPVRQPPGREPARRRNPSRGRD